MIPIPVKYMTQIPVGSWIMATAYRGGADEPEDTVVYFEVTGWKQEKFVGTEYYYGKILKCEEHMRKWTDNDMTLKSFKKFFLLNDKEKKEIHRKMLLFSL